MNAIKLTGIRVPAEAAIGVAVEGSVSAWPGTQGDPALPKFDAFNQQRYYIDVFNRGQSPYEFSATASASWMMLGEAKGRIEKDKRLWVSVDWSKAPKGLASGTVKIAGANRSVNVKVVAFNPIEVTRASLQGFVEGAGYVSIERSITRRKPMPA